jgi:hypothetical protein
MARGERSERDVNVSRETDSVRLSALAADFHAACIRNTLQERYANSGKAIGVDCYVGLRDGVLGSRKGYVRVSIGDLPSRDQAALTNDFFGEISGVGVDSTHDFITNVDSANVSRETWMRYAGMDVGTLMESGYLGPTRERGFNSDGLEPVR